MESGGILGLIGFGEAAQAFCEGWAGAPPVTLVAYDRKVEDPIGAVAKEAEYAALGVLGLPSPGDLAESADAAISIVTADQAVAAAAAHADGLRPGSLYFDFNSVAPATKIAAAERIAAAGGRYVDVAVMSPVRPALLSVPLLLAGPHAVEGLRLLSDLGFSGRIVAGGIGAASAVKMARSIMVKGLEALTAECLLSACAAGVEEEVLSSLDASFPGWDWRARGDYNLERMMVHGVRRAAEMRESALAAVGLGQIGSMATAAAGWQARIGALGISPRGGLASKVDAILEATGTKRP